MDSPSTSRSLARRAPLLLVAALVVATAGCGVRLGDLQPPAGRKIVRFVDIVGNDALGDAKLTAKLFTRPEALDPAADKVLLDPYQLEVDARRIVSIYQAHGYFQAEVLGWRVVPRPADPHTVDVEFKVAEGKPTRVSFIARTAPEVNAAKPVDDQGRALVAFREQLDELIELEVGDVWTEAAHTQSKEQITRALYDLGFVYAQVIGDVLVSRRERTARVAYHIIPGPLTRVKEVAIVGNARVTAERIRRRVDLAPGDVVTPGAIRRVERQVGDLGVFSAVRIEVKRKTAAELLGDQPPTVENLRSLAWPAEVPLKLVVQEGAFSDFQFGVGLALDSERLSILTGRPRYLNRDVFGLLDTLDIRLDPAAVLLLDASEWRFGFESEVAYAQPSFFEEYTNLTLRTGYEYIIQDALNGHRFKIGPGFSRSFFDGRLAGNVGYTFQFDYFPDLECGEECTSVEAGTLDLRGLEIREQYLTAYLSAGLALDLRDSVLDPRMGLFASFDVAFSNQYLGSDFFYVRMVGDLRLYATPLSFLTLAARVKVGGTIPIGDSQTPLPARFIAGGANDFRGQSADHLGPALCRVGSALKPGGADGGCEGLGDPDAEHFPVGGNLLAVATVEARWYLTSLFGLATFLDIGQVWADRADFDPADLQVAPGGGLRLFTPIGAIRADLAYNLTEANTVFHMSLGQAF